LAQIRIQTKLRKEEDRKERIKRKRIKALWASAFLFGPLGETNRARWPLYACRAGPPRQPASPRPHRDQVVAAPWGLAVILRAPVPPDSRLEGG
jgi:hypothetical protein